MQVSVILADPEKKKKIEKRKLQVCAYCRVSTEQEEQELSYEAQIRYYTDKINSHKDWEMVKIYADDGISGTSLKRRDEFKEMIEACKKGKIDLILTKSISRFARNTLDCLQYVRLLKSLGVSIIFEKEGINTSEVATEMLITIFGSFAQAESESISLNVTWGVRQSFKQGKIRFNYNNFLGYRQGTDKKPEIVPEEAVIVKEIFYRYLDGESVRGLKKYLECKGYLSPGGNKEWSVSTIRSILKNEKYMGDCLLQKSYTVDFLNKTRKKNNGEVAKYYVTDSHEGIIPKNIFYKVQEEIMRRSAKTSNKPKNKIINKGRYSSKYALTDLLFCGECGTKYRRTTWARKGTKKIVWRCINRLEYGKKYCKNSPTIQEEVLQKAIINGINRIIENKEEIRDNLEKGLKTAILSECKEDDSVEVITARIETLNTEMRRLLANISSNNYKEEDDIKFRDISQEIKSLQDKLKEKECKEKDNNENAERINDLLKMLGNEKLEIEEYAEEIIKKTVEKIKIIDKATIKIEFYGGLTIIQNIIKGE